MHSDGPGTTFDVAMHHGTVRVQFVEDIWAHAKTHPDVRAWADHFINTPVNVTP